MADTINSKLIAEAIDVIINTRDFCGNEREAVYDLAADHGLNKVQREALYRSANFHASCLCKI